MTPGHRPWLAAAGRAPRWRDQPARPRCQQPDVQPSNATQICVATDAWTSTAPRRRRSRVSLAESASPTSVPGAGSMLAVVRRQSSAAPTHGRVVRAAAASTAAESCMLATRATAGHRELGATSVYAGRISVGCRAALRARRSSPGTTGSGWTCAPGRASRARTRAPLSAVVRRSLAGWTCAPGRASRARQYERERRPHLCRLSCGSHWQLLDPRATAGHRLAAAGPARHGRASRARRYERVRRPHLCRLSCGATSSAVVAWYHWQRLDPRATAGHRELGNTSVSAGPSLSAVVRRYELGGRRLVPLAAAGPARPAARRELGHLSCGATSLAVVAWYPGSGRQTKTRPTP